MESVTSVVIIDDHLAFGEQLETFLRDQLACTVAWKTDAAAGMELIRMTPPDIALIDLSLPGENSFSLAQRLLEQHPGLRVVLMGNVESADYRRAAAEVGATAYLPKAVLSQQLPELLGLQVLGSDSVSAFKHAITATSRRGLVLEGALGGGMLIGGIAVNEPLAAMAGAAALVLITHWVSTRVTRLARSAGSVRLAATLPLAPASDHSVLADGVRGSPERRSEIGDPL
jgi:CheY-like chemotaxis protein